MSETTTWKIKLSTPMGPQDMTAVLTVAGSEMTGTITSMFGEEPVAGSADGNTLRWTMHVTKPTKIDVDFDVQIDGDSMTGNAKLGMFGKATLAGTRA